MAASEMAVWTGRQLRQPSVTCIFMMLHTMKVLICPQPLKVEFIFHFNDYLINKLTLKYCKVLFIIFVFKLLILFIQLINLFILYIHFLPFLFLFVICMYKLCIYYTIRYIAHYFICYTTLFHLSNLQPY